MIDTELRAEQDLDLAMLVSFWMLRQGCRRIEGARPHPNATVVILDLDKFLSTSFPVGDVIKTTILNIHDLSEQSGSLTRARRQSKR